MNLHELYGYLIRARRDLWATLENVPDEVLSRPLLDGDRMHSIKDLIAHTAGVEDGWLHYTFLQDTPVEESFPAIKNAGSGPAYAPFPLSYGLRLNLVDCPDQKILLFYPTPALR